MEGNNILQKSILEEWVEGIKKAKGPKAKQILRKRIAEKYGLGTNYVQGIIELGAAEGLIRVGGGEKQGGRTWEVANYNEVIKDLKAEMENLKRRVYRFADEIEKGADAAEAQIIFVQNLRKIARWMKGRDVIDLKDYPRLK